MGDFKMGLIAGILLTILIAIGPASCGSQNAYKSGQIDAQTGKIIYQLVEQPNGEKTWQRIKE